MNSNADSTHQKTLPVYQKNAGQYNQVERQVEQLTPSQKKQWFALDDKQRKLITWAVIVIGGSIAGYLLFLLIRSQARKAQADKVETESFGKDKYATWAKELRNAFDNDGWWGTSVPEVRKVIQQVPSQEEMKWVQAKYKKLYKGENLVQRMTDELTSTEYTEMLAIIQAKPKTQQEARNSSGKKKYNAKSWAIRIHAALEYSWFGGLIPGTDEDAIVAVFAEIPTQKAFYEMAYYYKQLYGVSVWIDLDGDLNWSLDWRKLLKKKPKA